MSLSEEEKALRDADKAYKTRVKEAELVFAAAKEGKLVARYGKAQLYADRLVYGSEELALTPDTKIEVDASGAKTGGKHSVDTRELYLLVENAYGGVTIKCRPDDGEEVRRFAQKIRLAGPSAAAAAGERKRSMEGAARALEQARADRGEIEAAERALPADAVTKVRRRQRFAWVKWGLAGFAGLLVLAATVGESDQTSSSREATTPPRAVTEAPPRVLSTESVAEDGETVRKRSIELTGVVSEPAAEVTAEGGRTSTSGHQGQFTIRVRLKELGENTIYLTARKAGFESANETVHITRKRTAAELASLRERRRQRREQQIAELRATAEAIDPELLQKNPDRFTGKKIVISGEIFQIQEEPAGGGFFLMKTECETAYEIRLCDGPTVHVNYTGSNDKTEDDFATVYGTVVGGLDYDTAIGGSNYVASINAKIVE